MLQIQHLCHQQGFAKRKHWKPLLIGIQKTKIIAMLPCQFNRNWQCYTSLIWVLDCDCLLQILHLCQQRCATNKIWNLPILRKQEIDILIKSQFMRISFTQCDNQIWDGNIQVWQCEISSHPGRHDECVSLKSLQLCHAFDWNILQCVFLFVNQLIFPQKFIFTPTQNILIDAF